MHPDPNNIIEVPDGSPPTAAPTYGVYHKDLPEIRGVGHC